MADVEKVQLTGVKVTGLGTLYGKAMDARAAAPILGDRLAAEAVRRLDYDFEALRLPEGGAITLPMRAWHFDRWTRQFIADHPESVVLHLGCGLDTRVFRVDPPPTVLWYDVDHPDVLALRERLYPERAHYERIGRSVTDLGWLDAIPADRPALVVAEGLVHYLPEPQVVALLRAVAGRFPAGEVAFDAYSRLMLRLVPRLAAVRADAPLLWAMGDPKGLEAQVPGLRLVEEVPFLTMPELVARLSRTWSQRAGYGLISRFPFYRRAIRHLRYAF
jgi:O-methyltransferase involved in polyketide biosynthesis